MSSQLYENHKAEWTRSAQDARALMASRVESGHPTVDDIKKALMPLVELNRHLKDHLVSRKLTQQYWTSYFTDFILEKVYRPTLHPPATQEESDAH